MNSTQARQRKDGKGDAWANAHRDALGPGYNMGDIDGSFGFVAFGHRTEDRIFAECVPDAWTNRGKPYRRFATVALFDRKRGPNSHRAGGGPFDLAYHLDLCRKLAEAQPLPPRFFFVQGTNKPPWELVELDIGHGNRGRAGVEIGRTTINSISNWGPIWDAVGLTELRKALKQWVETPVEASREKDLFDF